jgi:hypothetical protein
MSKVKHIVLLKFKDGITEEQIDSFFDEVLDISETATGVEDYVSGTNCSLEKLNQGFTHGFVMTFTDAPIRDAFIASEEHSRYKKLVESIVETTTVFDFEL